MEFGDLVSPTYMIHDTMFCLTSLSTNTGMGHSMPNHQKKLEIFTTPSKSFLLGVPIDSALAP